MAVRQMSTRSMPAGLRAPQPLANPVMKVRALTKVYGSGDTAVRALDAVNVDIERGRFTAIMGPSGSGKSTFMHCLAGFESITSGSVTLDDIEIAGMGQRALTTLRRTRVGFIFQSFNLIPTLSAAENIRLPHDISRTAIDEDRFAAVVDALDLRDRLTHRPAELSGGQQQRVACARALMQQPTVLFADEPTGNLDSRSTEQVLTYLRRAVDDFHQTVVMVTHEPQAATYADTVLFLTDGRVVAQLDNPTTDSILDALAVLDGRHEAPPASAREVAPAPERVGDDDYRYAPRYPRSGPDVYDDEDRGVTLADLRAGRLGGIDEAREHGYHDYSPADYGAGPYADDAFDDDPYLAQRPHAGGYGDPYSRYDPGPPPYDLADGDADDYEPYDGPARGGAY